MPRAIRPACPADAGWLAAIDADVSFNPWSERQFAAGLQHAPAAIGRLRWSLTRMIALHGFVVFSQVLDEGSIHNIAVHPAHQRKGLGRLLLEALWHN